MTIKDVLQLTVDQLSNISVPVAFQKQIGEPIYNAIGNLNECLRAMAAADQKAEEEPAEEAEEAETDGRETDPE
jgi:hypothetical protein